VLNVALTGNVASGKSTVSSLFREWGATVIDADALVREVQRPGTPVFAAIVARFGPAVVTPDGTLDRQALRQRILADPGQRRALESIVHPVVAARRAERVAEARARGARILVNDIPLLFEALDPSAFDAVILVDAPEDDRRERLVGQRGLAPPEADRLMAVQIPASAKRARSDFVIENDGSIDTLRQRTLTVWNALRERAGIA